MSDPILILIQLNNITCYCDSAQSIIDSARSALPSDQYFQLVLDRKQSEVDDKRKLVEALKWDISRRN